MPRQNDGEGRASGFGSSLLSVLVVGPDYRAQKQHLQKEKLSAKLLKQKLHRDLFRLEVGVSI